jgi:hypothetical protein
LEVREEGVQWYGIIRSGKGESGIDREAVRGGEM